MTKKQRVFGTIRREHIDYLPSQITLADRTRDKQLHAALKLPATQTMDEYLENHIIISLAKQDYPLFFRNDTAMMKELEKEGFCKVDEAGKVVYDGWGMGVRVGEDGFFACFHPLENQLERTFAEKWMPPRLWDAVTAPTLAERIRKWTPPDPDQPGNYDWNARDIKQFGDEYFLMASGYFGLYERCYGMMSIPTMFETVVTEPKLAEELLEKITDYKIGVAKNFVKMKLDTGHVGDDLGTQNGPFVPPKIFTALLLPQYKRLFKVYKDAGWLMSMHSCGCVTKFLPELIEAGLDVLEPVQPCMDLPFIKKEYGKHLTFWGGIDTQQLLPFGSPDDVRREVAKVIRLMGKGGGHIIAPSQEVMKDVPLANIVALLETIVAERGSAHGL
jgi:uroporphyrinogen decarboxylase